MIPLTKNSDFTNIKFVRLVQDLTTDAYFKRTTRRIEVYRIMELWNNAMCVVTGSDIEGRKGCMSRPYEDFVVATDDEINNAYKTHTMDFIDKYGIEDNRTKVITEL
jgi:hypothetical protein